MAQPWGTPGSGTPVNQGTNRGSQRHSPKCWAWGGNSIPSNSVPAPASELGRLRSGAHGQHASVSEHHFGKRCLLAARQPLIHCAADQCQLRSQGPCFGSDRPLDKADAVPLETSLPPRASLPFSSGALGSLGLVPGLRAGLLQAESVSGIRVRSPCDPPWQPFPRANRLSAVVRLPVCSYSPTPPRAALSRAIQFLHVPFHRARRSPDCSDAGGPFAQSLPHGQRSPSKRSTAELSAHNT